jgi:hypothetical protein
MRGAAIDTEIGTPADREIAARRLQDEDMTTAVTAEDDSGDDMGIRDGVVDLVAVPSVLSVTTSVWWSA